MACKYKDSCVYEICMMEDCCDYEEGVMTNADRIREMSDEEMAKYISGGAVTSESACRFCKRNNGVFCNGEECRGKTDEEIIMEWLRQPAEVPEYA